MVLPQSILSGDQSFSIEHQMLLLLQYLVQSKILENEQRNESIFKFHLWERRNNPNAVKRTKTHNNPYCAMDDNAI